MARQSFRSRERLSRERDRPPGRPAGAARVFFALWPTPERQRDFSVLAEDLRRTSGGRATDPNNIHLTLVFVGDVARERIADLEAAAASIECGPFALDVDRVEYWPENNIVWAGVSRCPGQLEELVAELGDTLRLRDFRFDAREYVPHITLLRHARGGPRSPGMETIPWPIGDFALVESVREAHGIAYRVLGRWPLQNR